MTDSTDHIAALDDVLMTIDEAAALVRAPVATLRYWRHLGIGPRSFRVGRAVRYWHSDVLVWLHDQAIADRQPRLDANL